MGWRHGYWALGHAIGYGGVMLGMGVAHRDIEALGDDGIWFPAGAARIPSGAPRIPSGGARMPSAFANILVNS